MTTHGWQPFWVFAGDESFDPNSGLSFSIRMYVIDQSRQVSHIELMLYKPQVFGLWHCLWNNEKHIQQLQSQNIMGVVCSDSTLINFAVIPFKDYYPFPHVFQLKPYCISHEDKEAVLLHIEKSVVPLDEETESQFLKTILHRHVPCVSELFDILDEELDLDGIQKNTIISRWGRTLVKDLVENQKEEYDIT
jgi:hypothetical protein